MKVRLEVALALPEEQHIATVLVPPGTNTIRAIELSNIFDLFDAAVPADLRRLEYGVGIFGKEIKLPEEYIPKAGERIEIYRALTIDPQQARINRIKKKRASPSPKADSSSSSASDSRSNTQSNK